MSYDILRENYLEDTFGQMILGAAEAASAVTPRSYYNEDGDCIEIRLAEESYYAERADGLLTLFIGRNSGKVVGAVIKEVRKLVHSAIEKAPGFRVEIMDDDGCKVEHILSLVLWGSSGSPQDECTVKKYKYLRDAAEQGGLTVDLKHLETS